MSWAPRQKVVVPIDFSDDSFAALDTALDLVDDPKKVHVIYVLAVLEPAEPGVIWATIDEESRARHAEQALRERLADAKYQGVSMKIEFGDPGHEVAQFAQEQGADLIVLNSHGRTGIKRLLIGSVAERIVRLAHCPVLVLRK
jgi:nucleotide-binding universal stress UspA family protein